MYGPRFSTFYRPLRPQNSTVLRRPDRVPLLPPAAGIVLGIICDAAHEISTIAALVLFTIGVIPLALGITRGRNALLLCAAAACGILLHDVHARHVPGDHATLRLDQTLGRVHLEGNVLAVRTLRSRSAWGRPRQSIVLDVRRGGAAGRNLRVRGRFRVVLPEDVPPVEAGQRLHVAGRPFRFAATANPGADRGERVRKQQRLHLGLHCRSPRDVQRLPRDRAAWLVNLRQRIASRFAARLLAERPGAGLLEAMVLGRRQAVAPQVTQAFETSGTAHFLALSGMHLGVVACLAALTTLWWATSTRRRALLALAMVLLYGCVVEPSASIHRALGLAISACLACLLRLRPASLNALCAVAIALLLADPLLLFSAGFQLSFTVTLGLMLVLGRLRPPAGQRAGPRRPNTRPRVADALARLCRAGWTACVVCLAAWIWSAPLVAMHFERLHPWAACASLVLGPVMLVTMTAGLAHLLLAALWPVAAGLSAGPAQACGDALAALATWMSALPASSVVCPPPAPAWVVAYYVLLWLAWRRAPRRRVLVLHVVAAGVLATGVWAAGNRSVRADFRLTALAVPGGSATLVEAAHWGAALFDCGSATRTGITRSTILPALRALGVWRLRTVIVSQAHAGRLSGIAALVDAGRVGRVVITRHFVRHAAASTPARALLDVLERREVRLHLVSSDSRSDGMLPPDMDVLWPPPVLPAGVPARDCAMVLRWRRDGVSALLIGRLGAYARQRLLEAPSELRADLLVAAVPGAIADLDDALLAAIDPAYVVAHSEDAQSGAALRRRWPDARHLDLRTAGAVTARVRNSTLEVFSSHSEPAAELRNAGADGPSADRNLE